MKKIFELTKNLSSKDKILYKNFVGVFLLKGIAIIISFLSTSFYIKYFKDDSVLGVWYTIINVLQWILTFDMGVGNGLRNKIAANIENKQLIRNYISSGYLSIILVSLLISLIGCILFFVLDLNVIFNIPDNIIDNSLLLIVLLVSFLGIMMQFVLKLVTSILYALQKNILANLTMLITNTLVLIFLVAGSRFDLSSIDKLLLLAIVYSLAIVIPLLVQTFFVFKGELKGCTLSLKCFSLGAAKEVLSLGGMFFVIQLGFLFLTSTNSWFISYFYSPNDVVVYQNYYKVFSLVSTFFSLLSQPLWSSFSVALKSKDYDWIRKKNNMVILFAGFSSVGAIILTLILPFVFKIWVGDNYSVDWPIAFTFCLIAIEHVFMFATTSLANGMSKLIPQLVFTILVFILKVPLVLVFNFVVNSWMSIIISEAICMAIIVIIQPIANWQNLRKLKEKEIILDSNEI